MTINLERALEIMDEFVATTSFDRPIPLVEVLEIVAEDESDPDD